MAAREGRDSSYRPLPDAADWLAAKVVAMRVGLARLRRDVPAGASS